MLTRVMYYTQEVSPGYSSQTSSFGPELIGSEQQVVIDNLSFNVGSFLIQVPEERTWDDVLTGVLQDYARSWERLADL